MKTSTINKITCILTAVSVLAGCATPTAAPPAGVLKVVYSHSYPDGSTLKETPTEVRLVTRQTTNNHVATQIGINMLLLTVGAFAFRGFSKDDLKGKEVADLADRRHLQNPIPTAFVARLQARVDAAIEGDETLRQRVFDRPLVVGGGSTRLVYESLLGPEEEEFRLKTDLVVYRARGSMIGNSFKGPVVVDCAGESPQALPQARWAEDNYLSVKAELDAMLLACENKVLASLGDLLNG